MRTATMLALIPLASLIAGATALAQDSPEVRRVALVGGHVVDGTGIELLVDRTILIEDSVIVSVFATGSESLPAATDVIAIAVLYGIPGLIDTHVHLATEPEAEDAPERTRARLEAALYGGVTSVRDMAGDVRVLAGLSRAALVGTMKSPGIYYAALFAGPEFFDDPRTHSSAKGLVPGEIPWMRAITPETDFPAAVAEAKGSGATAIKLYALLDSATIAAVVAEAHRQGLLVWAHAAVRPATPGQVIGAGVDAVSHAFLLGRAMGPEEAAVVRAAAEAGEPIVLESDALSAVIGLLVERDVQLDPTLFVHGDNPALQQTTAAVAALAFEAGASLSVGTDSLAAADVMALPNIHVEMELLVTLAGLSPAAAIVAGTLHGARTLGIADRTGTLQAGKWADLVVLRANPVDDIRNTREVEFVMKKGGVYRRE